LNSFKFFLPTKICFGKGEQANTGEYLRQFGAKNILFLYGGGSIKKSGLYEELIKSLNASGITFTELGGVKPNPRLSKVREGIELCRKNNIDFILAVGGGSVIDSAKAIALGAFYDGDVWDYFTNPQTPVSKVLPIGVVLTIPAAGSESSFNLVISKEEGKLKRSYANDILRPKFAILNPELCYTLPDNQISNGVADILAHMLERYFTTEKNNSLTDMLLESGMKNIIKYGRLVHKDRYNYDCWAEIMWTGCVAHNNMLSCGRTGDWASHGIEHEISALYDVAHGAGLATVFPAWMKYVYKNDIMRFAQFANRVFDIESDINNLENTVSNGINALKSFFESINLPTDAKSLGMNADDFELMAKKLMERDSNNYVGNFVKLRYQDVVNILKLTL
jgi:alcohol dehydrogenase YqhD (iron-dependent ADH family)